MFQGLPFLRQALFLELNQTVDWEIEIKRLKTNIIKSIGLWQK